MRSLEVCLPCFNEEACLEASVERLWRFLSEQMACYDWSIHIVDNGSTDKSPLIGRALARRFSNVRYTRIEEKGRGRALRHVWLASNADYMCYMDTDLATDLIHLPELISALENGADLSYGSRLHAQSRTHRSIYRESLSRGYNLLVRWLFRDFRDAQCGFKAINSRMARGVVPLCTDPDWFFDTEMLVLAAERGYVLKEVPVAWTQGPRSSVNTLRTSFELLWKLFGMRFRLWLHRRGVGHAARTLTPRVRHQVDSMGKASWGRSDASAERDVPRK